MIQIDEERIPTLDQGRVDVETESDRIDENGHQDDTLDILGFDEGCQPEPPGCDGVLVA